MKTSIIYIGKYGATLQYAAWLAEALKAPLLTLKEADQQLLNNLDIVILGSSVYVGKLMAKEWLFKNQAILKNKKIYLFIVCLTGAGEKDKQEQIIRTNVPASLAQQCRIFFLPGRVAIKKLSWVDRIMIKMGAMLEPDPVKKKAMVTDVDNVVKTNLAALIAAIPARQVNAVAG